MGYSKIVHSCALAAGFLLATTNPLLAQGVLGRNLIVNGDAETGPAVSSVSTTVATIPGWTRTGNLNVLSYNTPTSIQTATVPAPPDHGFQFFAAGSGASSITQDIDVSSAAAAIAAGTVKYTAGAYLGTPYGGQPNLNVAFKNAKGQIFSTVMVAQSSVTGAGANAGNAGLGFMYYQQSIGVVPPGTVLITVTLNFASQAASDYGTADSLALQLDMLNTTPTSVTGHNLIVNGDAESGPNRTFPGPVLYIPGWSSDTISVAPYGGTGWIQTTDPGPTDRGTNLFAGSGSMYQYLDVSAASSLIDSGKVTFAVSSWLGGLGGGPSPKLTYDFLDWNGKILVATAQIGPATHNGSSMVLASANGLVPAGTRVIHVSLTFPNSAFVAAFADDISFILNPQTPPQITNGGVVPVYSTSTTIQPGSWVSLYGSNLASSTTVWNGDFPKTLGNVSVTVNSKPAYLWYVGPTQVNFQAPDDTARGPVNVTVTNPNGSATTTVTLGDYAPSFSLYSAKYPAAIVALVGAAGNSGQGYDYIGPSGSLSFPSRPVKAGETVILFGVGFGPTNPPVASGQLVTTPAASTTNPTFTVGGVPAQVAYSGIVAAGLYQFNIVVPNAGSGDKLLQATVGGLTTQSNIYLTIQ